MSSPRAGLSSERVKTGLRPGAADPFPSLARAGTAFLGALLECCLYPPPPVPIWWQDSQGGIPVREVHHRRILPFLWLLRSDSTPSPLDLWVPVILTSRAPFLAADVGRFKFCLFCRLGWNSVGGRVASYLQHDLKIDFLIRQKRGQLDSSDSTAFTCRQSPHLQQLRGFSVWINHSAPWSRCLRELHPTFHSSQRMWGASF